MALLIKKAKFKNTTVNAPEVYVRLQYTALADGKKVSVLLMSGLTKEAALAWQTVPTNIPDQVVVELAADQTQDLAIIHEAVKAHLQSLDLGLTITVSL